MRPLKPLILQLEAQLRDHRRRVDELEARQREMRLAAMATALLVAQANAVAELAGALAERRGRTWPSQQASLRNATAGAAWLQHAAAPGVARPGLGWSPDACAARLRRGVPLELDGPLLVQRTREWVATAACLLP